MWAAKPPTLPLKYPLTRTNVNHLRNQLVDLLIDPALSAFYKMDSDAQIVSCGVSSDEGEEDGGAAGGDGGG